MSFIDKYIKQGRGANELGSYVENLGFIGTVEQNDSDLEFVCQTSSPSLNFQDFKLRLAAAIKAGEITSDTMSDEWANCIFMPTIDSSFVLLKHACIYSVLAEIAYSKSETEKAWSLLARSCSLCGSANASKENTNTAGDTNQRENARKGGQKRGNALQPVRQEVVRLLNLPPAGGWGKSLETRRIIAQSLMNFKKNQESTQKNPLFPTNIEAALLRWFSDCSEIRDAYEANAAEAFSERKGCKSSSCNFSE